MNDTTDKWVCFGSATVDNTRHASRLTSEICEVYLLCSFIHVYTLKNEHTLLHTYFATQTLFEAFEML